MPEIEITLAPEWEQYIANCVRSGEFDSEEEVIRSVLQLHKSAHYQLVELGADNVKELIQQGLDDVEAGRVRALNIEELKERIRRSSKKSSSNTPGDPDNQAPTKD